MKSYSLNIEPTNFTPACELDWTSNTLSLKGRSLPYQSDEFYSPITSKIEQAFELGRNLLTANFQFEYVNANSSKCIYNLLEKLSVAKEKGATVIINWFYEEGDMDMKESGEDYEEILGLRFNYIPT